MSSLHTWSEAAADSQEDAVSAEGQTAGTETLAGPRPPPVLYLQTHGQVCPLASTALRVMHVGERPHTSV